MKMFTRLYFAFVLFPLVCMSSSTETTLQPAPAPNKRNLRATFPGGEDEQQQSGHKDVQPTQHVDQHAADEANRQTARQLINGQSQKSSLLTVFEHVFPWLSEVEGHDYDDEFWSANIKAGLIQDEEIEMFDVE